MAVPSGIVPPGLPRLHAHKLQFLCLRESPIPQPSSNTPLARPKPRRLQRSSRPLAAAVPAITRTNPSFQFPLPLLPGTAHTRTPHKNMRAHALTRPRARTNAPAHAQGFVIPWWLRWDPAHGPVHACLFGALMALLIVSYLRAWLRRSSAPPLPPPSPPASPHPPKHTPGGGCRGARSRRGNCACMC